MLSPLQDGVQVLGVLAYGEQALTLLMRCVFGTRITLGRTFYMVHGWVHYIFGALT
jgi:hypothetical protein